MSQVTFLRLRPTDLLTPAWASACKAEGTTTVEVRQLDQQAAANAATAGLATLAVGASEAEPMAWVLSPQLALVAAKRATPGWRITVEHSGNDELVLDALARTESAFLRTGRSRVAESVRLASTPGLACLVSVFVDSVAQAITAVEAGAADLLLRDWDSEAIGALRDRLAAELVERTALPPGLPIDLVRDGLAGELFRTYLNLVDASGAARPRAEWAPGKAIPVPAPPHRLSAQWSDACWRDGGSRARPRQGRLEEILARALVGEPPTRDEIVSLFQARGGEVEAIAEVADELRRRRHGDVVTYVVNRNINYTNVCTFKCGFCAFSKGPRSLNLRGEPYLITPEEVAHRAEQAWGLGATEVTLQGGIHPEFTGDFYVSVVEAIKARVPQMHIHGFTPLEVWQGAETLGVTVRQFLTRLQQAGLGTLPGTAAEILDDRVRRHLCPDKVRTSEWASVMLTAHFLGMRSTSTIMFGHIDDPEAWANHFEVLRQIQRRTGGITEFIPLPFVHMGAPIYLRGASRPGPTWDEVVLMHAVGRLAFDGLINNLQASWVKLGLDGAGRLLSAGCNDVGGTLMDENISRAAGASHGQGHTAQELEAAITAAARVPARRNTVYDLLAPIRTRT